MAGEAQFQDVSGVIFAPDWTQIPAVAVVGNDVSLDRDGVVIHATGQYWAEIHASVLHNWGKNVIFGLSTNGGLVSEIGRVQIASSVLQYVSLRKSVTTLEPNVLTQWWVTSDFGHAELTVAGAELLVVHK